MRRWSVLAIALVAVRCTTFSAGGEGASPPDGGGGDEASTASEAGVDGATVDAGPCGDVLTSRTDCGRCGHDCLGGACDAGRCEPVVLAAGNNAQSIAVDATYVYWVDPNSARVAQMNKDGTGAIDLSLNGAYSNYPNGLAVDGANVYWGGILGYVVRCKVGGCANSPVPVGSTTSFVDLAVDDTTLFWIDGALQGRLQQAPKTASGDGGTSLYAPGDAGSFDRVVVDPASVFVVGADGAVRRVAKVGGGASVVTQITGRPGGLAVDDSNVYVTSDEDPGNVVVAAKSATGVAANVLAAGQHHPRAVATDALNLYWVNAHIAVGEAGGAVVSCSLASCGTTTTVLAADQAYPVAIAVDATAIYWANYAAGLPGGAIMKLAKP